MNSSHFAPLEHAIPARATVATGLLHTTGQYVHNTQPLFSEIHVSSKLGIENSLSIFSVTIVFYISFCIFFDCMELENIFQKFSAAQNNIGKMGAWSLNYYHTPERAL